MNWQPGKKYKRRGGGWYLFIGHHSDGRLLVETQDGTVYCLSPDGISWYKEHEHDILPELYPVKYTKEIWMNGVPKDFDWFARVCTTSHLFGPQVTHWEPEKREGHKHKVLVTVEYLGEEE